MKHWIPSGLSLKGETIELHPLEEKHIPELEVLAQDKRIWEHIPYDCSLPGALRKNVEGVLTEKERGSRFPFVIYHKSEHKLIGSTSFLDIQEKNRKLEIGATWLHPDFWANHINLECKLLLLTYCFEELKAIRVQLKTDALNMRSRKAIEKIGGQFEGILRSDLIREKNGTKRDSAYYSLLEEEWPEKKRRLIALYRSKRA